MGMVHWFKGMISAVLPASLGQGAESFEKRAKPRLLDVTDGYYLVEEAKRWGVNLFRRGRVDLDEFRNRFQMRRRVKRHLSEVYNLPPIVDEVTETLVEQTRHDNRLKRLFS